LTVTANPQTKVYGADDPALTYIVSGLQLGDTEAAVITGALTRAPGQNVGTYAITQDSLASNGNYTISYVGANLTVTRRAVTISADAKTKVYGESDPALTYQITSGSLAFSDAFAGALTRDAGEAVGSYAITQGTVALSDNYDLTYVGANLGITTRAVTVTANSGQTKTYGEADPTPFGYAITSGSLAFSDAFAGELVRAAGEAVGGYAIEQGTLALDSNYALTYVPANFSITRRAVTISADAKTKVYGESDPALTYQITSGSLAFSDTFAGALTRDAGEAVESYAITQGTVTLGDNYSLSYLGAALTITRRAATVTADAKTKIYGELNPALTATVAGTVNGDVLSYTLATTAVQFSGVGAYPITVTLGSNPNYEITPANAALTVTRRAATVTADAKTKVYGEANPALTASVTGTVNNDTLSYTLATVADATTGVGSYAITVTLGTNPNYDVTPINGALAITGRAIGVTADAKTKLLAAPDPVLTYQITSGSLVNGDTFSGGLTRDAGEQIGTYGIKQGTLTLNPNYQLSYTGANLNIEYRWDGFLQPINDTAHTGAVYSSFKLGQTIPAKFELKNANGAVVVQTGNPLFSRTNRLGACNVAVTAEILTEAVTADGDGIYKFTGSQYHYGWSTKGLTPGLYRIFARLADNTSRSVDICLTK
jgi:hypothetical protein